MYYSILHFIHPYIFVPPWHTSALFTWFNSKHVTQCHMWNHERYNGPQRQHRTAVPLCISGPVIILYRLDSLQIFVCLHKTFLSTCYVWQVQKVENQKEPGSVNGEATIQLILLCPLYHSSHKTCSCSHCLPLHRAADSRQRLWRNHTACQKMESVYLLFVGPCIILIVE